MLLLVTGLSVLVAFLTWLTMHRQVATHKDMYTRTQIQCNSLRHGIYEAMRSKDMKSMHNVLQTTLINDKEERDGEG